MAGRSHIRSGGREAAGRLRREASSERLREGVVPAQENESDQRKAMNMQGVTQAWAARGSGGEKDADGFVFGVVSVLRNLTLLVGGMVTFR